jgi:hypothetical protein
MLVKCNFPDHYAGHVQLRAAERRPVGRKQMTKDQPSAVAFTKTVNRSFRTEGVNIHPIESSNHYPVKQRLL